MDALKPLKISKTDRLRLGIAPKYRAQIAALWKITGAAPKVADKEDRKSFGNLSINLTVQAVPDPNDLSRVLPIRAFYQLTLPAANPDVDGHKAPGKWAARKLLDFMHAIAPTEYPAWPMFVEDKYVYDGEEFDRESKEEVDIRAADRACDIAEQLWDTSEIAKLVGTSFFAYYGIENAEYSTFVGFFGLCDSQPNEMELTAEEMLIDDGIPNDVDDVSTSKATKKKRK
jgi:hypothetical protein